MMRSYCIAAAALAALLLGGCATAPSPPAPTSEAAPPPVPSTAPFMPVATVLELMESVIAHAAEAYWGAVQVIVDENGVTENFPETDEEWEEVWAAAMSIAESGNLLMMAPRAVDNGPWMRVFGVVDRGRRARRRRSASAGYRTSVFSGRAGLQRLHRLPHALHSAVTQARSRER